MKLGSLKEGGRDGTLIVVSRDLARAVRATAIAPTLQRALEDWENAAPRLHALYEDLKAGNAAGAFDLDVQALAAPVMRHRLLLSFAAEAEQKSADDVIAALLRAVPLST